MTHLKCSLSFLGEGIGLIVNFGKFIIATFNCRIIKYLPSSTFCLIRGVSQMYIFQELMKNDV